MRKQNKVRRLTLLTAMFTAALAHAGVFDDAAFWVRGFRDGNDDGLVAGGTDVPDARNANASANVTASGVAASRIWREETVVCPYSGETFTAPCCYLAQTTNETDNLSYCANFSVTDAERVAVTNGMGTVVARVRPELGLVDSASWLSDGAWNTVRVFTDRKTAWVEVNGVRGEVVPYSDYFFNQRYALFGASHPDGDYFRGDIRSLKVSPR